MAHLVNKDLEVCDILGMTSPRRADEFVQPPKHLFTEPGMCGHCINDVWFNVYKKHEPQSSQADMAVKQLGPTIITTDAGTESCKRCGTVSRMSPVERGFDGEGVWSRDSKRINTSNAAMSDVPICFQGASMGCDWRRPMKRKIGSSFSSSSAFVKRRGATNIDRSGASTTNHKLSEQLMAHVEKLKAKMQHVCDNQIVSLNPDGVIATAVAMYWSILEKRYMRQRDQNKSLTVRGLTNFKNLIMGAAALIAMACAQDGRNVEMNALALAIGARSMPEMGAKKRDIESVREQLLNELKDCKQWENQMSPRTHRNERDALRKTCARGLALVDQPSLHGDIIDVIIETFEHSAQLSDLSSRASTTRLAVSMKLVVRMLEAPGAVTAYDDARIAAAAGITAATLADAWIKAKDTKQLHALLPQDDAKYSALNDVDNIK